MIARSAICACNIIHSTRKYILRFAPETQYAFAELMCDRMDEPNKKCEKNYRIRGSKNWANSIIQQMCIEHNHIKWFRWANQQRGLKALPLAPLSGQDPLSSGQILSFGFAFRAEPATAGHSSWCKHLANDLIFWAPPAPRSSSSSCCSPSSRSASLASALVNVSTSGWWLSARHRSLYAWDCSEI